MSLVSHQLRGLTGTNMSAFMAALGVLRIFCECAKPKRLEARLSWSDQFPYHPNLHLSDALTNSELSEIVHSSLAKIASSLPFLASHDVIPDIEVGQLSKQITSALETSSPQDRLALDWLSSLGFEGAPRALKKAEPEEGTVSVAKTVPEEPTLRVPRVVLYNNKSDGTAFIRNARYLFERTTALQIEQSLFSTWDYDDYVKGEDALRLGWDANEALASIEIGQIAKKVDWKPFEQGGNTLAVIGFTLMSAVPLSHRPGGDPGSILVSRISGKEYASWPIWNQPLSLDAVKSILTHHQIHQESPSPELIDIGVCQVIRSEILSGKARRIQDSVLLF